MDQDLTILTVCMCVGHNYGEISLLFFMITFKCQSDVYLIFNMKSCLSAYFFLKIYFS